MSKYFENLEKNETLIRAFAENPKAISMVMKLEGGEIRRLELSFPRLNFQRDSAFTYGPFSCIITKK